LSLATMRLAMGQSSDKILAALALSSVTGANEGRVMARRALVGLWQWEILSPRVRGRVAADLAGAMLEHVMSGEERTLVHGIVSAKPAAVRREIADLLRAEGLSANDLGRVGL